MATYKVRDGFFLHLGENNVKEPGAVVELSPSQAEKYAHQIELVKGTGAVAKKMAEPSSSGSLDT